MPYTPSFNLVENTFLTHLLSNFITFSSCIPCPNFGPKQKRETDKRMKTVEILKKLVEYNV